MKNLTPITRTTLAFVFTFVLFGMQNHSFAAGIELKDGTAIRLKQMQTITSADARAGQLVSFEVLEDVRVGNTTVINQGTLVVATIVEAKSKKIFGRKGKLSLRFDYVQAVDGSRVPLRSAMGKILAITQSVQTTEKGQGMVSSLVSTAAFVAGSTVMPYAAVSNLLLKKGKDVGAAQGQLVDAYVEGTAVIKIQNKIINPKLSPTSIGGLKVVNGQNQISVPKLTTKRSSPPARRNVRRNR
jgi:hypothetical protein